MKLHNSQGEIVSRLRPQTVCTRRLPINFNQDNIALFSHELERQIPETNLLVFQGVRVSSDGILFKQLNMLPESFAFLANRKQWKLRAVLKFFAINYAIRRSLAIEHDVLWITDDWSAGYFHWLTDVLTRLFVVRNQMDDFVLVLPSSYESLEFVHASLKAFGVKEVEFLGKEKVLKCPRLFMPTHTAPSGHYNEEVIRGVRRILLQAYGNDEPDGAAERIYISRRRARMRRIINEEEVIEVLSGFQFQTVYAEDHSLEQQVKICSRARYLVANHGAGLTNMLFMPEGSAVLELRHQTDRINNCYFTLSSALNLKYFYQTCRPENNAQDPHEADLVVDAKALSANLSLLFGA